MGVYIPTTSLHAEFQMFMKGAPWNLMSFGLVDDHGYSPWLPDAGNYLLPLMFGDLAGDGRTDAYYWDGVGWGATGDSLNDNAWNKVTMDWDHVAEKFTITLNNGTPWEAPAAALGTATIINRLQFFPAPGVAFFDEILIQTGLPSTPDLLEGDANRDGQVSAGDYASVQSNFGNTGAPNDPTLFGDANLDGLVSAGDYASVQANFGNTASASIPEPTILSLLALGGVALQGLRTLLRRGK